VILTEVPARALAVFAHPDDPEIACAGTLAAWATAGCAVHLVVCNAGDKGSFDAGVDPSELASLRATETAAASDLLGLTGHEILGVPDGALENDTDLRVALVERIRATRPDVVIAPDPTAVFFGQRYVNHHDHRSAGWAVLDACAPMAASPLYFPEAGQPHQVGTVLLAGSLEPDTWVDVSGSLAAKVAAVGCHQSQLSDGVDLVGEVVRRRAEDEGASAGGAVRYAEGFRRLLLTSG
jgi:LmbE family N-acetylglucosaminyl deacetylase